MAGGGSVLFALILIVYTVNAQIDFDLAAQNVTLSTTAGSYGNYSELCEPYYTNYNKNELEAIEKMMYDLNISTVWLNIRRHELSDFTWLNGQIYPYAKWIAPGFDCAVFQANSEEMIALSLCTTKYDYALCNRNSMHAGTNSKCSNTHSNVECYTLDNLPYILVRILAGNWFDGVNQCNQMGSTLASIPTAYNRTILSDISSAIDRLMRVHVDAWIGLRKQEFQYYTSANSSESVTKYYWEYSSPCQDRDCTGKDCVVQQRSQNGLTWKADRCTSHHHLICGIKIKNSTPEISRNQFPVIAIVFIVLGLLIFIIIMVLVVCCIYKQGKKKTGSNDSADHLRLERLNNTNRENQMAQAGLDEYKAIQQLINPSIEDEDMQ